MSRFDVKFFSRLAVASTAIAGVTLGSLSIASASSPPPLGTTSLARSSNIQFSGQVSAYSAASGAAPGSITLTDQSGATLTFDTSVTTMITQIGGSGATLAIDDFATVQAPVISPHDASSISFSAAAPVSFSGIVTAYSAPSDTAAGSVTLVEHNEATLTYSITAATIISENGGGNSVIAVDDFASVQVAPASPTIALAIAFDASTPFRFEGRVTAYVAASGVTPGSISVKDSSGSQLTFAVWSTTRISDVGAPDESLAVGERASVVAAASAKSDAMSITVVRHPRHRRSTRQR